MTPTREQELTAAIDGLIRAPAKLAVVLRFGEHAPDDAYQQLSETRIYLRDIQDLKAARMTALAVRGV